MARAKSKLNLFQAFQAVSQALDQKRDDLNEMDSYNHDHGDNMVEIFQVIAQAMKEKRNASPADQLAYASELLRKQQTSGSAQIYSQNLSQASQQFQGQSLNSGNIMQLIQALLGAGTLGSGTPSQPSTSPLASLAGSLLGGLTGGSQSGSQAGSQGAGQAGLDMGDLLSVGMTLLQNQPQGQAGLDGLLSSLLSGSQLSESSHRTESGKIVANTLVNSLLPLLMKK